MNSSKPRYTIHADDGNNRFLTYFQYICTISNYLEREQANSSIINHVTTARSFAKIQGKPQTEIERIAELLRNSWYTEEQINLSSKYGKPEYSNHWTPIQMYYASYLMIRSLEMAKNSSSNGEHTTSMRFMSSWIKANSDLFPAPWGITCEGTNDSPIYNNLPPGIEIGKNCPITRPWNADFYDSYGMFLKSTRRKILEKICDDYKSKNRIKRLKSEKKIELLNGMAATNFYHCLYRLRLRSNYEDADSFISSMELKDEANMMAHAICQIVEKNHLLLELLVCRHIGKSKYSEIVNDFNALAKNSKAATRYEQISSAF